jgi:nucleoid-associated protein YejK
MTKDDIEEVAVCMITKMHERYDTHGIDDAVYIPLLKMAIEGATDCADDNEFPDEIMDRIEQRLYDYAKSLYMVGHELRLGGFSSADDESQASAWFDYIYEHEEYPE